MKNKMTFSGVVRLITNPVILLSLIACNNMTSEKLTPFEIVWTKTDTSFSMLKNNNVHSIAAYSGTVLAGTNSGLSISSDYGNSWRKVTTSDGLGDNNVIGTSVSGSIFTASTSGGFSMSTDSGFKWTNNPKLAVSVLTDKSIRPVIQNGTIYLPLENSGLYSSSDFGKKWTLFSNTYGSSVVAVSEPVVVIGSDSGIAISTNSGSTWQTRTVDDGLFANTINDISTKGTSIYLACAKGLSISEDSGKSWKSYGPNDGLGANQIEGQLVTWFQINRVVESAGVLFAATSCGLYTSINNGKTWQNSTKMDPWLNVVDVAVSENGIYIVTAGKLMIGTF